MAYQYKKQSKKLNRKSIIIGAVVTIVLCAAIFILAKQIFHSTTTIPSTTSAQSKQKTPESGTLDKQNNSSSGSSTDKSNDKTSSPSTTNAVLLAPSGSFVSNHRPSLSSNGSPSSEQSVCNTTPGATCEIQFTKGTETKKLAAQTVDSNGSTYWNWDINSAGLTEGQWQITAYATLNGKTLTATDAMALDVGQ